METGTNVEVKGTLIFVTLFHVDIQGFVAGN